MKILLIIIILIIIIKVYKSVKKKFEPIYKKVTRLISVYKELVRTEFYLNIKVTLTCTLIYLLRILLLYSQRNHSLDLVFKLN